jgi:hypothetical protein
MGYSNISYALSEMSSYPDLTILVSSADTYEDCWDPFFLLFKKFWPDCKFPIVLITEQKDYGFEGLNLTAAKIGRMPDGNRWPFSDAVIEALKKIETKYILWTLDDLFLTGPVESRKIEDLVRRMSEKDYTHIHLTPNARTKRAYLPSSEPDLWTLSSNYRYRLSLLNGLWNRKRFLTYLRPGENPWQVEIFGSRRACKRPDSFFCVKSDSPLDSSTWPIPYLVTGVTKGQWEHKVEPLFEQHGINVDYSRRGFYRDPGPLIRRMLLVKRTLLDPKQWMRS